MSSGSRKRPSPNVCKQLAHIAQSMQGQPLLTGPYSRQPQPEPVTHWGSLPSTPSVLAQYRKGFQNISKNILSEDLTSSIVNPQVFAKSQAVSGLLHFAHLSRAKAKTRDSLALTAPGNLQPGRPQEVLTLGTHEGVAERKGTATLPGWEPLSPYSLSRELALHLCATSGFSDIDSPTRGPWRVRGRM